MITNSIKVAWRNLFHNRLFSVLNIFGLAMGLTIAILLSLYIIQERSFDAVPQQERIFRYLSHVTFDGTKSTWSGVPNRVGPTVQEHIPEVELSARTVLNDFGENANFSIGDNTFIEDRMYWADPDITRIFDLHFIYGDGVTALKEPNSIIISASKARQYFGKDNPLNKTILYNRRQALKVTGVYEDLPANSTFDATVIGTFSASNFMNLTWDNNSFETWIRLSNASARKKVEEFLPKMIYDYVSKEGTYYTLSLQPLKEVHFNSDVENTYSKRLGDPNQLRQLIYLALALLLMAAINYMNLATARAQQRSKEVGIRKTLGVSRKGLIAKFYAETAVLTFIAIICGLILAILAVPLFNALSGKTLMYTTLMHPVFLVGIPVLWLTVTLIAGLYPALVLSSYSPIEALRKQRIPRSAPVIFRHALVVLQFSASIILIVGVIVMNVQMKFISQRKLGYNPENVMAIRMNSIKNNDEFDALKNKMSAVNATLSFAVAQAFPGKGENTRTLHKTAEDKQGAMVSCNYIQGDITGVLQLKLLAGRMIKDHQRGDTTSNGDGKWEVVLNKAALDYLGLSPQDAIGRNVMAEIGNNTTIVGVVDNFNFSSLHSPVAPYYFSNSWAGLRYILVRFKTGNLRETVQQYEKAYKEVMPEGAFDYTFLDSHLKTLYQADEQMAKMLTAFSLLAILVGCLGLFGLTTFTAEKRTKEIGVRKVLGATVPSLVRLLCTELVRLVLIAFVIACPLAYWGFGKWLQNFAYRIDLQWWMFGLGGLMAFVIALLTVSTQAIRAAIVNPVHSLRNE
ncbi:ABC transporter permease [Chitinophaga sancti]|uniref:FtsX-like permease family protein n=1 Tax=Chitinophaga sancti TaxID=1004 RepID=A0A1K1NFJ8_9BACT|nr:ABC transporter permease [Chitinophaga sancti]WQD63326.1 FtsX-like permease family protein [Chitinophaga sancti]WQG91048.1 FtsX-like permease family protein [Chitinophaga sancti]SFW33182.1 putative ABC transport system permease protein [Chitinophaga sancti]